MHEADDAYSIQSTWSCYWLDQFLTLALNILILLIFYISMDLSSNYFAHFSGCRASFVCSCHSIPECCVTFSGVKMSIRWFVLFLAGIDAASRYKVGRPLRTKQAHDVTEMIADIYKVGPLTYPKIFQCDNGSEFKGDVTKMLEKNEVKIRGVTTKYKHSQTAFVEALNKILAERLFKVQDAQELNDPENVSSRWVKHLYGLVDELNDTKTEMIGMKPKDAIKN